MVPIEKIFTPAETKTSPANKAANWASGLGLKPPNRRASSPTRRPRSSYNHGLNRTGFYRHSGYERRSNLSLASLTFQRQASMELVNSFPRKSSFRASTFHPFLQCPPLPVETESQLMTLSASTTPSTLSTAHSPSRPDFRWSSNSLRMGLSTPPPPAYESIIKAFPDS